MTVDLSSEGNFGAELPTGSVHFERRETQDKNGSKCQTEPLELEGCLRAFFLVAVSIESGLIVI